MICVYILKTNIYQCSFAQRYVCVKYDDLHLVALQHVTLPSRGAHPNVGGASSGDEMASQRSSTVGVSSVAAGLAATRVPVQPGSQARLAQVPREVVGAEMPAVAAPMPRERSRSSSRQATC